jgi:hypothetical protein
MTVEIYQTFHRAFPRNKSCDWITPVAVGNYSEPGMIKDNTGTNIAHLNAYFGEFTTMYWAWQNRTLPDIVGFYHYRRYLHLRGDDDNFEWAGKIDKGTHYQVDLETQSHMLDFVTSDEYKNRLEVMFESTDAVMGFPMRFDVTVPQQWSQCHPMPAFYLFIEELEKQYSAHSGQIRQFFSSYGQINWPIVIMRKECFIRFCNNMFPLLFAVFNKIGTPYDAYQNRYVCFLVERFIPMWLLLERINPIYVPTMTFFTNEVPLVPGQVMQRGEDGKIIRSSVKTQNGF